MGPATGQNGLPVIDLRQAGEIPEQFGSGPDDHFWNISGLCIDSEGDVYVADRGWAKIIELDRQGRFLRSFGRKGQGPGEFSADTGSSLDVTIGNDGFLYIYDGRGSRLSRFDRAGKFLDGMPLKSGSGSPAVNSKGEVHLVANGDDLISVFSRPGALPARKFFPASLHFDDPFLKPAAAMARSMNADSLLLSMAANDRLVAVSNESLKAFVFGPDSREIRSFDVGDESFRAALRKRYDALIKSMIEKGMTPPRARILPFGLRLAPGNRLLLSTFNSERKATDVLVYSLEGRLEAQLRFPEGIRSPIAANDRGELFGVREDATIVRFHPPFPGTR